jgi:folate-binding protein YgfZ
MDEASNQLAVCSLEELGLLAVRGADARRFLQGQLSNDVMTLAPGALLRAGLHTPQGRTLAVLHLLLDAGQTLLALLPRELCEATLATLRRYVLRAKVQISDESANYQLFGLLAGPGAHAADAGAAQTAPCCYPYQAGRQLLVLRAGEPPPRVASVPHVRWRALDIAAGLPQVYRTTSGQFVAQMLNLDCIEAISFQKGCYTGQEVIARAHYRGRVKRRMQRFLSAVPLQLAPGDTGRLPDGRQFRVVDAVLHSDGRCEFLAVAPLPGLAAEPDSDGASGPTATAPIEATPLPLPYALPA